MGLFGSICCFFAGRCGAEDSTPSKKTMQSEQSGNLGQKEAELEKASEEELRHMKGGETER